METFGDWLRTQIGRADLTERKFARAVGVSHPTIGKWLSGEARPRRDKIARIGLALGLSEDAVWDAWQERGGDETDPLRIIARVIPKTMTPHEARLVAHLLRANIRALQDWNEEEEEQDEAMFGERVGSSDGGARPARRLLPG